MSSILDRISVQRQRYAVLNSKIDVVSNTLFEANESMSKILQEQDLLERTTVAIQQSRPLLSASSIKQCENLANSAISSVFGMPYTVEYNVESYRFTLNKGDYCTDLAEAEGGGIITVISFIFQVYLLVKLGKRRFMAFDEAFTQISDRYFPNFIQFVRQLCKDLGIDIMLVSHDQRISIEDVDHCYMIEEGHSRRLK